MTCLKLCFGVFYFPCGINLGIGLAAKDLSVGPFTAKERRPHLLAAFEEALKMGQVQSQRCDANGL